MQDLAKLFRERSTLDTSQGSVSYYSLPRLEEEGFLKLARLPYSIRILLENLVRHFDGRVVTEEAIAAVGRWNPQGGDPMEIPFFPARVLLQDFTGVPAVADLAAMRDAVKAKGGDPSRINPIIPVDLVIDHSVQVDFFGTPEAFLANVQREFERNHERYRFLKWAQTAFDNFRVVPPGTGIVHQVNLEYLGTVVRTNRLEDGTVVAYPDTLVGTDSHTPMINGLSVLGWGVGGIEAEAVMLGQPYYMVVPEVVGLRLSGTLPEGATATDLVLTVTELLRRHGVVGKFVEFFGPGLDQLSLPDRATLANMAPEYGATVGFFPVDDETLRYLQGTGRDEQLVELVERYSKAQGLFREADSPDPEYTAVLELDMGTVEPSLAGPRRPQDRIRLRDMKEAYRDALTETFGRPAPENGGPKGDKVEDGAVVIAAITSCTNTSNPSVMVGAGLIAKKAVEKGLRQRPHVKTSLAPGSRVVTDYLQRAGLLPYLEQLGFHVVGYGCTTCIGNSGLLIEEVAKKVQEEDLVVAAVLSGNRNFEGRINPLVRANYLASPVLVVAYALAGTVDIDLANDPLGHDAEGNPVYLRDIWPTQKEIREAVRASLRPEAFQELYGEVFEGDEIWKSMDVPEGDLFEWDEASTYIQQPPFFEDLPMEEPGIEEIDGARVLVYVGDSITTDHISPAGAIAKDSPAGQYLISKGLSVADFNTYGARRGNHEVMVRGTFANIRLRNRLVPGAEGWWTVHLPTGEKMSVYDAHLRYREEDTPLIVLAGKEYGTGSSRDWAAKGTYLLGVRAVIAESYERIHRSNLVGMGVLPLQFKEGENAETLGLTGHEVFSIEGLSNELTPRQEVTVRARNDQGEEIVFQVIARVDTPIEVEYYRNGGILQTVLRRMLQEEKTVAER